MHQAMQLNNYHITYEHVTYGVLSLTNIKGVFNGNAGERINPIFFLTCYCYSRCAIHLAWFAEIDARKDV